MNRYRLGISILLFLFLLVPLVAKHVQAADPTIRLIIGGETYQPDVPPKIIGGRTLVPIRVVAEALGGKVGWDEKNRKVTVTSDSVDLAMVIGSSKATVNGKSIPLDVPPKIVDERTLVPLRFVGESLGIHVGWEAETRSVIVNEPYIISVNGKSLNEKVFLVHDELYFPLKAISPYLGAELIEENKLTKLRLNNLDLALDERGQVALKLKKMDTGWVIPKSTIERHLKAEVIVNSQQIQIEKLSQLKSIREESGRIVIDTTIPMPPKHFLMSSPNRLVIDFPNMIIAEDLKTASHFRDGMGVVNKLSTVVAAAKEVEDKKNPLLQQPMTATESDSETIADEPNQGVNEPLDLISREEALFIESVTQDESLIKEIRYSQFSNDPQTVRVVIELSQRVKYDLIPTESGYEVMLNSTPKKEGFLIVLDPGHGGKDPGALGVSGNTEKELTLAVSNYMAEELKQYKGLQVIQTRIDDTYPTLQDRVQMANDSMADLFLSIHANSFKPETRGTETFYYTSQSEELARIMHKHLLRATGFPDRGVKVSGFYVIKNTNMPSSLVEIGFLSNAIENAQMLDPVFQRKVAKALAQAVYEYYTSIQ